MGFKLFILSFYTPKFIIQRELKNINKQTTEALQTLIPKEVPIEAEPKLGVSIQEQRALMAQNHVKLVEALQATVGHEEAVKLGRIALFLVGQSLGREACVKLGVGDSPWDLERAAKVLYRVLGIDFSLKWQDANNATAVINRCALAKNYSTFTCEVLCATDEGVINGLMPNATMRFKQYMTGGCKYCKADIHFEGAKAK